MSLRKAKQLLQKKKQQQLAKELQVDQQQEQQNYSNTKQKNQNMFVFDNNDSDQNNNSEEDKQKQTPNINETQSVQKKKKKKKKKKNAKKQNNQEEELQKALKQLGMEPPKLTQQQIKQKEQKSIWETILQINQNKFNYQKQLRRHFKGWQQEKEEGDPQLGRKQQKMQKHLRKMMKKSTLSPGIKEFFPIRQKFQIETDNNEVKFVTTKKYDHYQVQYQAIRNSNDINALFMFTQTHPEHVDSLYAVGEFLRLQGNYRDADTLIQKVIYIYEMAGGFQLSQFINHDVTKKQIVYDQTSKSLFMSIFKFMQILGKKGCFRAALQYNKFLLKININDPTACLLCLDYNAISAKQSQFLVEFVSYFSSYCGSKNTSLYFLPNFTYSFSLAKYYIQNKSEKEEQNLLISQNNITNLISFTEQNWKAALKMPQNFKFIQEDAKTLLLRAIMVYPKLILDIARKNQYAKQFLNHSKFQGNQKKSFKQILEHQFWTMVPQSYSYHFLKLQNESDSKGLDKILEVYVQRSKILWKSNEIMLWVKGALGFVLNQIEKEFDYQGYLQNLCTQNSGGIPILFNLRRYENVSKSNFSDRVQRIDLNNIQDNQNIPVQNQNANRMNLEGNPFRLFLNSLLPWVNLPQNNNNQQNDPNMPFIQEDDD